MGKRGAAKWYYVEDASEPPRHTVDDEFTSIIAAAGGGDLGRRRKKGRVVEQGGGEMAPVVELPPIAFPSADFFDDTPPEPKFPAWTEPRKECTLFSLEERIDACLTELQDLMDALAQHHLRQRQRVIDMHTKVHAKLQQLLQLQS